MSNSRLSAELSAGTLSAVAAAALVTIVTFMLDEPAVGLTGMLILMGAIAFPAVQRLTRPHVAVVALALALGLSVAVAGSTFDATTIVATYVVAALTGHLVGSMLYKIDDAVESALYGLRARPLSQALPELQSELARSRRYERPLSVMVIRPDTFALGADDGSGGWLRLTSLLADGIRETDLLLQSSGRFIVVSPETAEAELAAVRRRIRALMSRAGLEAQVGSASFPIDGSSLETLLEAAHRASQHQRLEQEIA